MKMEPEARVIQGYKLSLWKLEKEIISLHKKQSCDLFWASDIQL